MSNEDDENYFISQRRTFHIQTDPQWEMSLSDDRTNVEINRIFLPIESNVLSEKIIEIQPISFTRAVKICLSILVSNISNLFAFRRNMFHQRKVHP